MADAFQITTRDNLKLNGKLWIVPQAKATILLIHGFGEHIGRYDYVAKYFNSSGFNVAGIDLRGHGTSEGRKGHTPNYQSLMDDIDLFVDYITEFSDQPLVLYGHSMGGNIATNYLFQGREQHFKALVLTSPWFKLQFAPPLLKVKMGQLMRRVWPTFSESNDLNPDDLSSDLKVGEAYDADPLVNDIISTEMFFSIKEAGERAIQNSGQITLPTLVMHGEDDKITSRQASEEFAKGNNASYKSWPGLRHEMHNEFDKEKVLNEVSDWLILNIA